MKRKRVINYPYFVTLAITTGLISRGMLRPDKKRSSRYNDSPFRSGKHRKILEIFLNFAEIRHFTASRFLS